MLHTVNKSPFEKNSLETCLRLSVADSNILLIEDGVYGALSGTTMESKIREAVTTRKIYALDADLKARGINEANLIDGIQIADYEKFVALAASSDKIQSWF